MQQAMSAQVAPAFTIGETVVRQRDGLFSLNDLHKAAGGKDRHRPNYFMSNNQTKALVAEISTAGIPAVHTINGGPKRGTYACRELVIAYAAWISAAFHLKVLRVFLDVVAPQSFAPQSFGGRHEQASGFSPSGLAGQGGQWILTFDSDGQPSLRPIPANAVAGVNLLVAASQILLEHGTRAPPRPSAIPPGTYHLGKAIPADPSRQYIGPVLCIEAGYVYQLADDRIIKHDKKLFYYYIPQRGSCQKITYDNGSAIAAPVPLQ
jgi:hypothetical protein